MGIVHHHIEILACLDEFHPAVHAFDAFQSGLDIFDGQIQLQAHADGRGGVIQIVFTGQLQIDVRLGLLGHEHR